MSTPPSATRARESREDEDLPRVGDVIGDKFRITETLGRGGMGVVLGGEHIDLRQAVAIKVLRPALAKEPDALARFLREARAAASIKSRHAVRIYDVGTADSGVPYIVMERLHGRGVDALLEERGPLATDLAVRIILEAADAIAEANGLGIIHRDVKPSNLFLADGGSGDPVVKVLDFGISKRVNVEDSGQSASLTAPQTLLGSPQYMSPEQLRDPRAVDERTDVWGLGVTLYELLTGRVPFLSESIPELCALIFNSDPAPVSSLRSEVPASLSVLVASCLEKEAAHRVPSAQALAARLAPFADAARLRSLEGAPKLAATTHEQLAPARRGRRLLPLAIGAAASVSIGIAFVMARGHEPDAGAKGASRPSSQTSAPPLPALQAPPPPAALRPEAEGSSPLDASAMPSLPDASSTSAAPSTSAATPAPAAPRARGLKSIKLLD